jgi:hypothetical protein
MVNRNVHEFWAKPNLAVIIGLLFFGQLGFSQDVSVGKFNNNQYENGTIGFILKGIPAQWSCTLNPQKDRYLSDGFPTFEVLGDSIVILSEFADTTKKSSHVPMRMFLIAEPIKTYESAGITTAEQFLKLNKDNALSNSGKDLVKYNFTEVRTTSNVGGDEFYYHGVTIVKDDIPLRKQMAFCAVKEGYFFVIFIDGFADNQELQTATNLLLRFWWTK